MHGYVPGSLSSCPGYLCVTINDRQEAEELFRYDMIVKCPSTFELTFKVPNWGLRQDRTFDVVLNDAKKDYRVFLTKSALMNGPTYDTLERKPLVGTQANSFPFLILSVLICGVIAILCLVVFVHMDMNKGRDSRKKWEHAHSGRYDVTINPSTYPGGVLSNQNTWQSQQTCCQVLRAMSSSKTLVVILYIAFKVVYSFLFTFSVFFTVIILCLHGNLRLLMGIHNIQVDHYNQSHGIQDKVEAHVQREVERQMDHLKHMQGACDLYAENLVETLLTDIEHVSEENFAQRVLDIQHSISGLTQDRLKKLLGDYNDEIKMFTQKSQKKFNDSVVPHLKSYRRYLEQNIFKNNWFLSAAHLYNETGYPGKTHEDVEHIPSQWLTGAAVQFVNGFLEVPEVETVSMVPVRIWQRYVLKWRVLTTIELVNSRSNKL